MLGLLLDDSCRAGDALLLVPDSRANWSYGAGASPGARLALSLPDVLGLLFNVSGRAGDGLLLVPDGKANWS